MRKILQVNFAVFFTFICLQTSQAAIQFKDMPEDHWAARSVYNVVRLGITRGYPDGTFRGNTVVNRYELMVFLSNAAIVLEQKMDEKLEKLKTSGSIGNTDDKVIEELRAEIDALRASLINYQQSLAAAGLEFPETGSPEAVVWKKWTITGNFTFRANTFRITGNPVAVDYITQRLNFVFGTKTESNGIRFDIDTGYSNPATEGLASRITNNILAVEAWAKTNTFWEATLRIDASSGPGDFELIELPSNFLNNKPGRVLYRPGNAIKLTWTPYDIELSGRFEKRHNNIDRSTGKIGYRFLLDQWNWGELYTAIGTEMYSQGGITPTNSGRTLYEIEYQPPIDWLTLSARGTRLITHGTEQAEYFSESNVRCTIQSTQTELASKVVRLSGGFYSDAVSDEIAGTDIMGFRVDTEYEAVGFHLKQYFLDNTFYTSVFHNTSTSMLNDLDKIWIEQEISTMPEFGWKISEETSLSIYGRNVYYRLRNDDRTDFADHLIAGQFKINF